MAWPWLGHYPDWAVYAYNDATAAAGAGVGAGIFVACAARVQTECQSRLKSAAKRTIQVHRHL